MYKLFSVTLFLILTAASAATAQQNTPPDLFVPIAVIPSVGGPMGISNASAASQAVIFNAWELLNLPVGDEAQVTLPRLGTFSIVHDRTESQVNGDVTWVGYFKNYGTDYRVIITSGPDGAAGRIVSPDGEFSLMPGAANDWLLDMKQARYEGLIASNDDGLAQPPTGRSPVAPTRMPLTDEAATAGNSTIDLMIVYTKGMVQRWGTRLQTRLVNLVQIANQAYIDSGISITLRLVHSIEIDYSETTPVEMTLNDLTDGNGLFSDVATLRNQYAADLVLLIRPYYSNLNSCGLAWISTVNPDPRYGYSVSQDGLDMLGTSSYCYDVGLAHELGHNMGAAHDRAHAGNTTGAYSYSYGYGVDGMFATIMAAGYITATPVGKFSNPYITCGPGNSPCGVADDSVNSADNVRTLNNTRAAIAAFASPLDITLTATPSTINYQGSSTLSWSSINASSCNATASNGWTGPVTLSGSQSVSLTNTTTYTLTCIGSLGVSISKSATVTVNPNPAACFFDWAENKYSSLFAPSGSPTQVYGIYTYRYYSASNAYLGISSADSHVYYLEPYGNFQDEGPLSYWLSQAGC